MTSRHQNRIVSVIVATRTRLQATDWTLRILVQCDVLEFLLIAILVMGLDHALSGVWCVLSIFTEHVTVHVSPHTAT
jgi:hypothetical protein